MSKSDGFLRRVPRRSRVIFLLGVFFIFSTIGLASDMSEMGRQPILRFVLSVFVISTFAVLYAVAGFSLRGNWWKAAVPLFIVHMVIVNVLNWWMPGSSLPATMDAKMIGRLHDRLSIEALAIVAAMALGYTCFVYTSITEGRRYIRVHAEIEMAREIHQVLVPTIDAKMGEFEFYGRSLPSGEVGGDLIDLAGTEQNWVAYLADVSGHGVAPGLVMGMAKSASRMLLTAGDGSDRLMSRLNDVLFPLKKPDMFITICFIAASGGRLRAGLAGHPAILRFSARTNEVTEIESPNMPLGIVPSEEFATSEIFAESGTLFALYTDGILETANAFGEEFGMERLKAELKKYGREPLEAVCRSIQEAVGRHGAQFDDQSMLLIRKL